MPLPSLIGVSPISQARDCILTVPGSKSITNRALVLAALGSGVTTLQGALWSEDTLIMVEAIRRLGCEVTIQPEPTDPCNRTIVVTGTGGAIAPGGSEVEPLVLRVGNAGTAARFLTAMLCLGRGHYRLVGTPRMHQRPQEGLLSALRQLGYTLATPNDRLPLVVKGEGPRQGDCQVSIADSSQFASALHLCAEVGGWRVSTTGTNDEESPYVQMTLQMVRCFPRNGGVFAIEADSSAASYFLAANALLDPGRSGALRVANWPATDWQIDTRFPEFVPLPSRISRHHDLGDSILTAMILAPFADHPVRFTDLARIRVQECDRLAAMSAELTKCGAAITTGDDWLEVHPGPLHGARIATYDDHRIAMCFATLGLKVPGISLENPACVRKTFPNFFQKIAAPPPAGLGAAVVDPDSGQELELNELYAD